MAPVVDSLGAQYDFSGNLTYQVNIRRRYIYTGGRHEHLIHDPRHHRTLMELVLLRRRAATPRQSTDDYAGEWQGGHLDG